MARIAPGVIPIKDANPYGTIRAVANEHIAARKIVLVTGHRANITQVDLADATKEDQCKGRLLLTRSEGQVLWVHSWELVRNLTLDAPVGAIVYLGTKGDYVFAPPKDAVVVRQIGRVVSDNAILFDLTAESDHENALSGKHVAPAAEASLPLLFTAHIDGRTKKLKLNPLSYPVEIIDVWAVKQGVTGKKGNNVRLENCVGPISSTLSLENVEAGGIVRSQFVKESTRQIKAGASLHVVSSGQAACTVHILARRL